VAVAFTAVVVVLTVEEEAVEQAEAAVTTSLP
jgi:hypothetical protein